jgi:hypothetical protein
VWEQRGRKKKITGLGPERAGRATEKKSYSFTTLNRRRNFPPGKNPELAAILSARSCHTTNFLKLEKKNHYKRRKIMKALRQLSTEMHSETCLTMCSAVIRN